jgi:cell division control protein 11
MLSRSHLNDLKSLTEDVLYENYRTEKLSKTVTDNRYELWAVFYEMANHGPLVSHKFFLRI